MGTLCLRTYRCCWMLALFTCGFSAISCALPFCNIRTYSMFKQRGEPEPARHLSVEPPLRDREGTGLQMRPLAAPRPRATRPAAMRPSLKNRSMARGLARKPYRRPPAERGDPRRRQFLANSPSSPAPGVRGAAGRRVARKSPACAGRQNCRRRRSRRRCAPARPRSWAINRSRDPLGSLPVNLWSRGQDLNLRPSGYEPDELPSCSTPQCLRAPLRKKELYALLFGWSTNVERSSQLVGHRCRPAQLGAAASAGNSSSDPIPSRTLLSVTLPAAAFWPASLHA